MHALRFSPSTAALAVLSFAVLQSSCSLPPREAWRQIRADGLIPFIANGMSAPKAQDASLLAKNPTKPSVVQPAAPKLASSSTQNTPPHASAASTFATAFPVSGLKGYVRTPYTSPARLVDVRGQSAGSKVVCPYTQRPFVIPAEAVNPVPAVATSAPQLATQASKPAPKRQSQPAPKVDAPKLAAASPAPPKPEAKAQPEPQSAPAPATRRAQATPLRVEKLAREQLHMRTITPAITQYATVPGGAASVPVEVRP